MGTLKESQGQEEEDEGGPTGRGTRTACRPQVLTVNMSLIKEGVSSGADRGGGTVAAVSDMCSLSHENDHNLLGECVTADKVAEGGENKRIDVLEMAKECDFNDKYCASIVCPEI